MCSSDLGLRVIRAFGRETYELQRYNQANAELLDRNVMTVRALSNNFPLVFFFANLGTLVVIGFGGALVMAGSLSIGELIAFNAYLAFLLQPILTIGFLAAAISRAAAEAVDAHAFIEALPQGYDTRLSEQASTLSQGQRQLLSFARAVLADPRILILDEATSSIDTRTEQRIQVALGRLLRGRTSIVIAHRLSTIRDADLILVIESGQIVERGNHAALLAAGGRYADLYQRQFRDSPDGRSAA